MKGTGDRSSCGLCGGCHSRKRRKTMNPANSVRERLELSLEQDANVEPEPVGKNDARLLLWCRACDQVSRVMPPPRERVLVSPRRLVEPRRVKSPHGADHY